MPVALLSVYNKEGITYFAKELHELGWEIIASGGTARELKKADIPVKDVAEIVGGGAILGHRVVTLSREIHAGLLAKDTKEDRQELKHLGIPWIDLVCVDLYPLQEEIQKPDATRESVTEKTDIGGPTMIRSAAKGRRIVICDPYDRELVIDWLKAGRPDEDNFIAGLVAKAEAIVADYCLTSARYHSNGAYDGIIGEQILQCLYGENAWQAPAALYSRKIFQVDLVDSLSLENFHLVAGTSLSYNNLCDVDRLLQTITHISAAFAVNRGKTPLIAVGCKHGNPCGAAVGKDHITVIQKMIKGDTRAILGGLVMVNFPINEAAAEELLTYLMPKGERRLLDGIIAPSFKEEAITMLRRKGDKCRFLVNPALELLSIDSALRFRYVRGGFLRQPNYTFVLNLKAPEVTKIGQLTPDQEDNLLLSWAIGSTSNSNTITLVKDGYLIGNGVGQQDRVSGCVLAVRRARDANHETPGAFVYSDSFFPFTDGPEVLAQAGVRVIFASSGSVRDLEVHEFCQKKDMVLYLIPDRVGRGFFGH